MKLTAILGACAVLVGNAWAAVDPAVTTYSSESHVYGVWDRVNPTTMTPITTTASLVFPGMTLAQLLENSDLGTPYKFLSFMCGSSVGLKGPCPVQKVVPYYNDENVPQFIVAAFVLWDNVASNNCHTKCVIVKFTDGEGGVYAQALAARYVTNADGTGRDFFQVAENGNISYLQNAGGLAQSYSAGGYGLCGLITAPFIPTTATTVWKNPAGEPVLTLDDIKDHQFSALMAGTSIGNDADPAAEYNRYEVRDNYGRLMLIRVEMQMLDDKYVKCVVVELTNAADGVAARAVKGCYAVVAEGAYIGRPFIKDHTTYNPDSAASYDAKGISSVSTAFNLGNYGLFAFKATPQPFVELILDRNKTWTELVAGVDVSDPAVTLKLKATAADAVLTFDQAIAYDNLVVTPSVQQSNAFRVAEGLSPAQVHFGKLTLDSDLRLALPPALAVGEIAAGVGSTVVYAGVGETPETTAHNISGGGGVEVASGTIVFANADSTYVGGTLVKSGAKAIPGAAAKDSGFALWTSCFGTVSPANLVTVEEGALFDIAGQGGVASYVGLAGADRVVNSGADAGSGANGIWGFVLNDDASLSFIDHPFHFIAPNANQNPTTFALGAHTFTKRGDNTVYLWPADGADVTGAGTFDVAEGVLDVDRGALRANDATLRVDGGATLRVGASAVNAKNVVVDGLVEFKGNGAASFAGLMSGTGTVRKVGNEWTATVQINNGSRLGYEVTGGVLKVGSCTLANPSGYYAFNTPEHPRTNVAVTVSGTGSFDFGGVKSCTPACIISGKGYQGTWGALCNRGADLPLGNQQMVQLTLAGDAQVGGTADTGSFGLLAPGYTQTLLELGEHTLTVAPKKNFYLVNTTITGTGKIKVEAGTLYLYNRPCAGDDYTLEIGEAGTLYLGNPLTTGSFVNHGQITGGESLAVKGTITTTTNAVPNLVLANGSTVKVSDGMTPLKAESLVMNGTITVDVAGIVPGENGAADMVQLFDVPASTVTSGIAFQVVNVEQGVVAAKHQGLPILLRSGLMIIIR